MTTADWPNPDQLVEDIVSDGYTLIRSPFPAEWIADLRQRAKQINVAPSIAGAVGFQVVDYARKVLNPCTQMGGHILDLVLYEPLLDLVEHLMGSACILAQAGMRFDRGVGYNYFPVHADFASGWTHGPDFELTETDLRSVLSIGCILYLTHSSEGAFTYLKGTHRLYAPKGSELSDYTIDEQAELIQHRVRLDGNIGDLVIFDPRGFHGPDFPSISPRLSIIFHFYNTAVFGRRQLSPFPIFSSDIGKLTSRQVEVLGANAKAFYDPLQFMGNRIRRTWAYKLAKVVTEHAFYTEHLMRKFSFRTASRRRS